ncbi:B-cell receptor CD22-like [Anableps anableps]
MKRVYQSLTAALSEYVLTVNMLLSVFFFPGTLAQYCDNKPAALNIIAPKMVEALNGSCLEIPFIFNSSKSGNTFPLNITGNMTDKNCTTVFPDLNTSYTGRYFFRVENGLFRATACDDLLYITVKDSPWPPSIDIPVGDLKEHQSVTITCSALTPCPHSPPELTWNLQQDSHRQTEKNTDGTLTTKIQEIITLSDTHDGYTISCSARYPVNGGSKTAETEVTLSVSYAPKDTSASISPSGLVSAGSWVELSCSSRAKPPPSFTWFRSSTDGAINVSVGQVYRFSATERGDYYCVATNDLGNQRSSIIQTVEGTLAQYCANKPAALNIIAPKMVEALNGSCLEIPYAPKDTSASISPSGLVSAGSWVELSCSSRARPPPSFTWFRNSTDGAINVSVGQVYRFSATERGDYYCVSTNDLGNQTSIVILGMKAQQNHLDRSLMSFRFFQYKRKTPQRTQTQIHEQVAIQANETEEELHYGDMKFLQRGPAASSVSVQDSGQQETIYAQVKVSVDSREDLYASEEDITSVTVVT